MKAEKNKFLQTEFFIFSWRAAVEHNKVWKNITKDKEKKEFRKNVKDFLDDLIKKNYQEKVSDDDHIKNIIELQKKTEDLGNRLNFGTCQKLFNMMCKYYWCADWISEPPHLPIDSINLKKIKDNNVLWTQLDNVDKYKELIEDFKQRTDSNSLSLWELKNWARPEY